MQIETHPRDADPNLALIRPLQGAIAKQNQNPAFASCRWSVQYARPQQLTSTGNPIV